MESYSSRKTGIGALLREARNLYRSRLDRAGMDGTLTGLRRVEALLLESYGFKLEKRDILDVGSGQIPVHLYYFSRSNRVTGIDTDVIAQGINPVPYLKMLFLNGPRRTAKTIVRKMIGIDRLSLAELIRQAGLGSLRKPSILRMDACRMIFPDASFDFVHCSSVFHHLPDPAAALDGIVRVLRPGGAVYIILHLFTSETGSLDPRVLLGTCVEIPPWAHLRRDYDQNEISANAYLNRLRLPEWRSLFESKMPGAKILTGRTERPGVEEEAKALIESEEIRGYDLEELVTNHIIVLWKKP